MSDRHEFDGLPKADNFLWGQIQLANLSVTLIYDEHDLNSSQKASQNLPNTYALCGLLRRVHLSVHKNGRRGSSKSVYYYSTSDMTKISELRSQTSLKSPFNATK